MDAAELRAEFAKLKPPDGDAPWTRHRRALRNHAANENPANFLRWSTIQATVFVGEAPYVRQEWDALHSSGEWERWERATRDPGFGGSTSLSYDPGASGNLVNQAFHLYAWEEASGQRVDKLENIMEVGGGYGAMCLVARHLGFIGTYSIIDEPELVLLQRYYLEHIGAEAEHLGKTVKRSPDLLIVSFTLAEVGRQQAKGYLDRIKARHYLIVDADRDTISTLTRGIPGVRFGDPVMAPHPGAYWFGERKPK